MRKLFLNKYPPVETPKHLEWIRRRPCVLTGKRFEIQAAHVRYGDLLVFKKQSGIQHRPSDCWALPLHYKAHEAQHKFGDERLFWELLGLDPIKICLALWYWSGDDQAGDEVCEQAFSLKTGDLSAIMDSISLRKNHVDRPIRL